MSEICSAYLFGQLQQAHATTRRRIAICAQYREDLRDLADENLLQLPRESAGENSNGHIFFFLAQSEKTRMELLHFLNARGVQATFHYTPLHLSPAGRRYGRAQGTLAHTERASANLIRLPVYASMSSEQTNWVSASVRAFYRR